MEVSGESLRILECAVSVIHIRYPPLNLDKSPVRLEILSWFYSGAGSEDWLESERRWLLTRLPLLPDSLGERFVHRPMVCRPCCKALYSPLQVWGENESFFFASGISNLLDLFIHLGAVLIIWRVFLPKIFEVTCPRNLRPV